MKFLLLILWLIFCVLAIRRLLLNRKYPSPSSQENPVPEEDRWEFADKFQKRTYLFYSASEFKFFKFLVEIYADQYYIFPQINIAHLVEPKSKEFFEHRRDRSRIEKKSVDFVICDKVQIKPLLVIELDGHTHNWESRIKRDDFVNSLMSDVQLPILRVKTEDVGKGFVKDEINKALLARVA
ncbi:DUF2726 domain-containing protein [Candidatus Nomurabacteria bacterium]|nr:DUF2726 domain-containing protein [Candidatus Nomurabacteria bacterium]